MSNDPQPVVSDPHAFEDEPDVAPHPEAMVSEVEFSAGEYVRFRARARVTPASLFAVGIVSVAILLALVPVLRAGRWR